MKKTVTLSLLLAQFFFITLQAQVVLPKFSSPVKMKELSNNNAEESMPLPFKNGNSIYFFRTYIDGVGDKAEVTGQDIWFSKSVEGKWEKPYRLLRSDDIRTQSSIIGTDSTGSTVYLFTTKFNKDSINKYLAFIVNQGKDKWSEPEKIVIPGLTFTDKYYSFYMNQTGDILMISMSPSEEVLDEDLYVSLKNERGNWSKPIHLGNTINTERYEVTPFISKNRTTLYFSSDGHKGFGQADVFVSQRLDETWQNWSKPQNLGEPINSSELDIGFVMGNDRDAFLISDRNSNHNNIYTSKADGDLRIVKRQKQLVQLYGKGQPLSKMKIKIEKSGGALVEEVETDNNGQLSYIQLDIDDEYMMKVNNMRGNTGLLGTKAYYLSSENKKEKRYILTDNGKFINDRSINGRTSVEGTYAYNNKAAQNTALVVLDENDFAIDTIYTDSDGQFSYELLKYDKGFKVVPLNKVSDWNKADLYLVGMNGEKIRKLVKSKNSYVFVPFQNGAIVQNSGQNGVDDPFAVGAKLEIGDWNRMAKESKEVYFNFREVELVKNEINKLAPLVSVMRYDDSRTLTLIGHTDDVGSKKTNKRVGLKRAESVKQFLVSKGVPANKIKTSSEGESEPEYDNSTEEGRRKNRRVELMIK